MTIASICSREVDRASTLETVHAAAQRMLQRNVGTLVVLAAECRPIGILTDRDIVTRVVARGLDPARVQVGDVMTEQPRTIAETASVEECLTLMRSAGVRRLPVIDGRGVLAGVISLDDVLMLLAREASIAGVILDSGGPKALQIP